MQSPEKYFRFSCLMQSFEELSTQQAKNINQYVKLPANENTQHLAIPANPKKIIVEYEPRQDYPAVVMTANQTPAAFRSNASSPPRPNSLQAHLLAYQHRYDQLRQVPKNIVLPIQERQQDSPINKIYRIQQHQQDNNQQPADRGQAASHHTLYSTMQPQPAAYGEVKAVAVEQRTATAGGNSSNFIQQSAVQLAASPQAAIQSVPASTTTVRSNKHFDTKHLFAPRNRSPQIATPVRTQEDNTALDAIFTACGSEPNSANEAICCTTDGYSTERQNSIIAEMRHNRLQQEQQQQQLQLQQEAQERANLIEQNQLQYTNTASPDEHADKTNLTSLQQLQNEQLRNHYSKGRKIFEQPSGGWGWQQSNPLTVNEKYQQPYSMQHSPVTANKTVSEVPLEQDIPDLPRHSPRLREDRSAILREEHINPSPNPIRTQYYSSGPAPESFGGSNAVGGSAKKLNSVNDILADAKNFSAKRKVFPLNDLSLLHSSANDQQNFEPPSQNHAIEELQLQQPVAPQKQREQDKVKSLIQLSPKAFAPVIESSNEEEVTPVRAPKISVSAVRQQEDQFWDYSSEKKKKKQQQPQFQTRYRNNTLNRKRSSNNLLSTNPLLNSTGSFKEKKLVQQNQKNITQSQSYMQLASSGKKNSSTLESESGSFSAQQQQQQQQQQYKTEPPREEKFYELEDVAQESSGQLEQCYCGQGSAAPAQHSKHCIRKRMQRVEAELHSLRKVVEAHLKVMRNSHNKNSKHVLYFDYLIECLRNVQNSDSIVEVRNNLEDLKLLRQRVDRSPQLFPLDFQRYCTDATQLTGNKVEILQP